MKLLFVIPEYPPDHGGGIATGYGALLPELVLLGHQVDVLVGSAFVSADHTYEHKGVRVRLLEPGRTERLEAGFGHYAPTPEVRRHLAAARAMWEQVDGGTGYDAVQVTDWGLLFAPWVAEEGPPSIVQLHGSSGQIAAYDAPPGSEAAGNLLRIIEASLLPFADALHTYSKSNALDWQERTGREVIVTPCAAPAVERLELQRRSNSAFVAARIQEWKGPSVVCEALRRLGSDAPTVEWAGRAVPHPETGESYDRVLAREYPDVWGSTFVALGRIRPEQVARRQSQASYVVVPSLWDVYNHTVVEAMQQEAVVICSTGAGASELIEDGVSGFTVPPGDDVALADALRRAADLSAADRVSMGWAARQTTLDLLSPTRIARQRQEHFTHLTHLDRETPDWLRSAVTPSTFTPPYAFLDHLPLKHLIQHVIHRTTRNVLE